MKPATPELQARRKAAFALNELCRQAELGTQGEYFDAEYHPEWAVVSVNEVRALRNDRLVATVELRNEQAILSIPDPYMLVKGKARDFNAQEHGFGVPEYDGLGNLMPWVIHIMLPEDIPFLNAPEQPRPRQARMQDFSVKRQL